MHRLWRLCGIALAAFLLFRFVLIPVFVSGASMEPRYSDGAFTFINRLAYLSRAVARGDVVAVEYAGWNIMLIKRIVALPGETLSINDGTVFINDEALSEPYVEFFELWNYGPVTLSANEYFIIGDNRAQSIDEHVLGIIEEKQIVGIPLW